MHRILLASAALLLPSSLASQRLAPVPAYAAAAFPPPSVAVPVNSLLTAAAIPRTYWLEGGVIGGIGLGIAGAMWFEGMSESPNPIGATIAGGALIGAVGFTAGALVGGQFRKSGHANRPPS